VRRTVSIIGGGPAGLMLASTLDNSRFTVTVFEQNAAPGRKFLVAGDGGLNLTHSEDAQIFISRYTPQGFLTTAFRHFNNRDLITWFKLIGIPAYTGSSGRVFPDKTIKPVTVLNAILDNLNRKKVAILTKHRWLGFGEEKEIVFENNNNQLRIKTDVIVLCMGGASWPVTGSTGEWTSFLKLKNIDILPFKASNSAFEIKWKESIVKSLEGNPLKNITVTCGDKTHKGEIVLTKFGVEGSGIYPLSPQIRKALEEKGRAEILIDLKPSMSQDQVRDKIISAGGRGSYTARVKKQLNLSDVQMLLLKDTSDKITFNDPAKLSLLIKSMPLEITGTAAIAESISTTGGISLTEINEDFMLKKMPGVYAIGEMLDYDAPTGGYLLQSCFTMGHYLGEILNKL